MVPVSDVDRGAPARHDRLAVLPINFDPPDASGKVVRQQNNLAAHPGRAGDRDAGHDGPITFDGKRPIQRQAKHAVDPSGGDPLHHRPERFQKAVHTLAGGVRDLQ